MRLMLAATCFSMMDLLSAKCEVLCQRDGFTTGKYIRECLCIDNKGSIDDLVNRRVMLPKGAEGGHLQVVIPKSEPEIIQPPVFNYDY